MQCPQCSFVCGTSVRSLRLRIQKMHSTSTERHADTAHLSNLLQLLDAQVDESPFNTDIPEPSVGVLIKNFRLDQIQKMSSPFYQI